ncbi:MAG: hypothetical protein NW703_06435 [Nitrospiraceae bacterium]
MKRVMYVFLLAMIIAPEVQAQTWPNEPSGSSTLVDCNFNNTTCGGMLADAYNSGRVISDGTAPASPTSVLLQQTSSGTSLSGGAQLDYYPNGQRELFVGFWVKLNSGFVGSSNHDNKVIFPGAYWVILEFWGPPGSNFKPVTHFQFNSNGPNNCHLSGIIAGDCPWGGSGGVTFGNACSIGRETWYRIEYYIKQSSYTNSRDGIVRWWVNGTQCYNATNVNTLTSPFDQVSLNHTWDGGLSKSSGTWEYRFDHLKISAPNGGGGAPKGDTTPPVAPTSLRAN